MNSNFILIILILIIIYLYYNPQVEKRNSNSLSSCKKSNKINPKDFNPAIHHPAAL